MISLFLNVAERSLSAAWMILAALLLRQILKKTPKWGNVLLWSLILARLLLPFSIESQFSLIPGVFQKVPLSGRAETAMQEISSTANSGGMLPLLSIVWIIGMLVLVGYLAVRYFLLQQKLRTAVLLRDNIYQTEMIRTPIVAGFINPRIYIPFQLPPENMPYILAHERSHIHRGDHWWKLFGFLSLAIHWFNPLVWVAYWFLCRDIEIACDEAVIGKLDHEARANYTQALVFCSGNASSGSSCQLGFGQVGIKERVKAILHYRKPARFSPGFLILPCILLLLCFFTASPSAVESSNPSVITTAVSEVPVAVPEDDVLLEQMKQELENLKNELYEQRIRIIVKGESDRISILKGEVRIRPQHQDDCPHCHP